MRISIFATVLCCLVALSSCGSDSFTIEGELSDAGTQNMHFVYSSGETLNSIWIPSVGGKFSMQGNSEELTVVYIFNSNMKFVTHVAVKNGETIKLSGSIADSYNITVSGSDVAEQWNAFIKQNAADFANGKDDNIAKSISGYIAANSENVVSTLLLTCDYPYINTPEAANLLQKISEDARPQQLLSLYGSELQAETEKTKKIPSLTLRDSNDSLVVVNLNRNRLNVFYFWYSSSNTDRKKFIEELKNINRTERNAMIADIYTNYDTATWRQTIKSDSARWSHYKALCGVTDKTIKDLNVRGENFIIVADSTGRQLYRGGSIADAKAAIAKR